MSPGSNHYDNVNWFEEKPCGCGRKYFNPAWITDLKERTSKGGTEIEKNLNADTGFSDAF